MLVSLCYFSEASSKIQDDLLIMNQLADLYNYESIAVFVNNRQDRNLKMFLKNSSMKIQFIEVKDEEIIFDMNNKVYFILLNQDELTFKVIDKALQTSPTIFSKFTWYIKVNNKSEIVKKFGNNFKFDSNVNILYNIQESVTEITEVYSVKQDSDTFLIKTNSFGIWSDRKLTIKITNIWVRRTDFFGTNLRYCCQIFTSHTDLPQTWIDLNQIKFYLYSVL